MKLIGNFMDAGKLDFTYAIKRQNLFNLGFTDIGLPCEFWLMAGDVQAPQWAHNFSLAYNVNWLGIDFREPDGAKDHGEVYRLDQLCVLPQPAHL